MKKTVEITVAFSKEIEKFKEYYVKGLEYLLEASKVYAASVAKHPVEAEIAYSQAFPNLLAKDWKLMLRIGRGDLTPRAFLIPNDCAVECVSTVPLHVQKALLGDEENPPVPQKVYSRGRVIEKAVEHMNAVELNAVFDKKAGRLRTIEEQMQVATKEVVDVVASGTWKIESGKLKTSGKCVFTLEEVARILRKMKGGK